MMTNKQDKPLESKSESKNRVGENDASIVRYERKGIYILPNLFTTASLFAGFYAIVSAMSGNFEIAAIAIFIAMVLDGLDGRVARWTHTESDFGAQYDSLVDMVSFGIAPALIMYQWALSGLGKIGWLVAFIYVVGAGLRLARLSYGVPSKEISIVALFFTLSAGILMVSNVPYRSFKDINIKGRVSFMAVLAVPLVLVLILLDPPQVLFGGFLIYVLSGPAQYLYRKIKKS